MRLLYRKCVCECVQTARREKKNSVQASRMRSFFFVSKMFKKSIDFQNPHTRTPKKPVLRCVLSKSNTTVVLLRNQFVTAGEAGHTGHMRIDGHVSKGTFQHTTIYTGTEKEKEIECVIST